MRYAKHCHIGLCDAATRNWLHRNRSEKRHWNSNTIFRLGKSLYFHSENTILLWHKKEDYLKESWDGMPVFHDIHKQRGHGLGSILDRSLGSAWPLITWMSRHLEKTWVLRTGLQIAKDVTEGLHFKRIEQKTFCRRFKSVCTNSICRVVAQGRGGESSEWEIITELRTIYIRGRLSNGMAFVHHQSCECVKSELDLFVVSPTQTR